MEAHHWSGPSTRSFDLAIAVAVLAAKAEVPAEPLSDAVLLGELALDGRLRAVPGVLPATLADQVRAGRRTTRRTRPPPPL